MCGGPLLGTPGTEQAAILQVVGFLALLAEQKLFDRKIDVDGNTPKGTLWTFEGARLISVETGTDAFQDYLGVAGVLRIRAISVD